MRKIAFYLLLLSLLSCTAGKKTTEDTKKDDGIIEFVFLQMNDVYEISPLEGGKTGGMARVATLRKQLLEKNKNTYTVHAGDFLNPSLYGALKYNGKKIKGKQMVEVMNATGIDLVTFGNHEFDIDMEDLQQRLNESEFAWVASNLLQVMDDGSRRIFQKEKNGTIEKCIRFHVWSIEDADGTKANIGFYSATVNSNPQEYVKYLQPYKSARGAIQSMRAAYDFGIDVVVGLTHLNIEEDLKMAAYEDKTALIMGGHEHDNSYDKVGNVIIAKADANVKTVYVHTLRHDKNTGETTVKSELIPITNAIDDDPKVARIVQKWQNILNEKIKMVTPDPYAIIFRATTPLDGREASIRHKQTNLGKAIAEAMLRATNKQSDAAFVNGGSVRIDDQLSGDIMAIDIFRTLPFGGGVVEVEMKGSLLKKVLNTGLHNKGIGGYLQWAAVNYNESGQNWTIAGQPLDENRTYRIATSDYLIKGLETNMGFFTPDNSEVIAVHYPDKNDPDDLRVDVRKAVISYLKEIR